MNTTDTVQFPVYENGGYEFSSVDSFVEKALSQASELQAKADERADAVAALQDEIKGLRAEMTRLRDEKDALSASRSQEDSEGAARVADLESKVATLTKQSEDNEKFIEDLETYCANLEATDKERANLLSKSQAELLTLRRRVEELEAATPPDSPTPTPPPSGAPSVVTPKPNATPSVAEESGDGGQPLRKRPRLIRRGG
jgi:uncharacterized coiled-coil protein SlyX